MAEPRSAGRVIVLGPTTPRLAYRLGGEGLLVLFDLLANGDLVPDGVVVTAGYRAIARRVGLSKDTVGRRMAALARDGLVVRVPADGDADGFSTPTYRVCLAAAGIEVFDQPVRSVAS